MNLNEFLAKLETTPENIAFSDTTTLIDNLYDFIPTAFKNGAQHNEAGQNNGSCKVFSFAQRHKLSAQQTLHCFGDYYRKDVLQHPQGTDHQNIRNFIQHGWDGIHFEGSALTPKQ